MCGRLSWASVSPCEKWGREDMGTNRGACGVQGEVAEPWRGGGKPCREGNTDGGALDSPHPWLLVTPQASRALQCA